MKLNSQIFTRAFKNWLQHQAGLLGGVKSYCNQQPRILSAVEDNRAIGHTKCIQASFIATKQHSTQYLRQPYQQHNTDRGITSPALFREKGLSKKTLHWPASAEPVRLMSHGALRKLFA